MLTHPTLDQMAALDPLAGKAEIEPFDAAAAGSFATLPAAAVALLCGAVTCGDGWPPSRFSRSRVSALHLT